ncbi:hypothetical protein QTP70_031403, partial [Hemibagrus guttatus]
CPPTHKERNVLDLVFTHPSPATDMTVTPLHISDHHLVSFTITLPVLPKHNSQHLSLTRRNLHSISPSSVASCTLSSLPDHESFSSLPLDSATDTLLSSLSSTMDLLCPLSTIRKKNSSTAPWLSDVLRNNRRELQSAARKWKKSKLDTDLISYRTLLSKFSLDVTSAKTSFYKEKLETSAQEPRKLHNIFSSLLNPPAPPSPSSLTAEDFATFYTEKIERICQTFMSLPTSPTSHSQHSATPSLTQLSTVASEEVLQITWSCNPTTCPLDPIPSAMLQTISPDLLPFITTVINGSLTSGHVPTAFKKARVIPILKKPALDPSDISNYRPNNLHDPNQSGFKAAHFTETALLAVTEKLHAARSAKLSSVLILLDLSAAFDTVNHKTLLSTFRSLGICGTAWEWFASYLDGRSYQVIHPQPSLPDTLDPLQIAYRPNRSTDDAISHLLHTPLTHLDTRKGNYVKMFFVDYSSAFNTIISSTLTTKLEHLGLSPSLCQWISNFLTGRPQAVRMDRHVSASLILSTEASQGCVLSPLLYSLYTYDCVATTNSTTIIKFADDKVVVGLISDNIEMAYLEEINNLKNWWQRNNLLLNVSKTKELIVDFRTKQERNYQTPVINESPVERVDSFRYLGVHITQDLSWSCHINTVVKKSISITSDA